MNTKSYGSRPSTLTAASTRWITLASLVAAMTLAACSKTEAGKAEAPPPLTVSVVKIASAKLPILVEVVGRTEGSREVEIRSRVTGIVEKQMYSEGEPVRANKALFQIERMPFENALVQARAALNQDRAKLEQAQRENSRLQGLLAKKAISAREADDAATGFKQAEAAVQSSEARLRDAELNLSYTSVSAPIGGITGRAQRSEGSLVNAGSDSSLLTTVTQTDPIWVRFSLSESEHSLLRGNEGKRAAVKLLMADDREYAVKGKLNFAGSTVDSKLGTVQLRAEFANPDLTLLPGQFVRTQLIAGIQDAIAVPQSAVFQNDQSRFVWVVGADSKATQRKVEAGSWVGHDWIIKSGLKADDLVITDNLIKLRPGMTVKAHTADTPPAANNASAQPATAPANANAAPPAAADKK